MSRRNRTNQPPKRIQAPKATQAAPPSHRRAAQAERPRIEDWIVYGFCILLAIEFGADRKGPEIPVLLCLLGTAASAAGCMRLRRHMLHPTRTDSGLLVQTVAGLLALSCAMFVIQIVRITA